MQEIADEAAGIGGRDAASLHQYLSETLHYTLGAREVRAIEKFQKYCLHYNLVPNARALELGHTGRVEQPVSTATEPGGLAEIIDISRMR